MSELCPCRQCVASGNTRESFRAGQAAFFKRRPDARDAEGRLIWDKWWKTKPAEHMRELSRLIKEARG
jgi:hypothetical protein